MIPVDDMVGTRFSELMDCGELIAMVLDRAGVHLSEAARSGVPLDGAVDAIRAEGFIPIPDGHPTCQFDLLLFRMEGLGSTVISNHPTNKAGVTITAKIRQYPHAGVVIGPGARFIHALRSEGVRTSSLDRAYWRHRLESRWRHEELLRG